MFKPFIAIGHGTQTDGSWDTGCTYGNDTEAEMAKQVVAAILEVLDANGKNYLTDYPANDKNMIRDVELANNSGCSHYMSIHLDWDQAPSGILPLIYPGSAGGLKMAEAIRASMKARIPGLNDRGNDTRPDLYEVRATDMPALIMEIGSIKADNALIKNNYRLFGHSIAYGLLDAAGESYNIIDGSQPTAAPAEPQPTEAPVTSGYNWDTRNVQYFLNICNYGAPAIDGIWGSETDACLRNAQRSYQIDVDGLWGPVTQSHAEAQIKAYQLKLTEKGIPTDPDGIAGPATYNNVKAFQSQNGLEMDGIVGVKTYAKLFDTEPPAQQSDETPIVNFTDDEFKCLCGCGGDVQHELKVKVQKLRNLLTERAKHDMPLVITSGYRCSKQNKAVGGVPDSLHMQGAACDLYTPGMSDAMINEIAYCAKQVGLGVLRYYKDKFCHVQLVMTDGVMN